MAGTIIASTRSASEEFRAVVETEIGRGGVTDELLVCWAGKDPPPGKLRAGTDDVRRPSRERRAPMERP